MAKALGVGVSPLQVIWPASHSSPGVAPARLLPRTRGAVTRNPCSSRLRSGMALAAAGAAGFRRRHEGNRRSHLAAGPDVVDVEDLSVPEGGGDIVQAVLDRVARDGVPLLEQRMEYVPEPENSPLRACGLPALQAGGAPRLVAALRAAGVGPDRAEVGAGILCLMLRGVDEAHNLITPHSWPSPTTYGGQPKHNSEVRREAAYCHVIVHRMEGTHRGEYGTGFHNSNYWIGSALGGAQHPIFEELRASAAELAEGSSDAKAALRAMGPKWDPRSFNRTCEEALLTEDEELTAFCAAVQAKELRLLFDHTTLRLV
mmetsp:Transcript_13626/g.30046  ORF Transcript_13626/g.30046 Transcript_13626/m.30046 type:complete len:315 (+) Transcript_13626:34-978(+)